MTEDKSLGLKSWLSGPRRTETKEAETRKPFVLDRRRVAVLPFASMSPDPNDEYFADGTTEEVISTLSNIRDFVVISRTSIMQYKGAKKNLADIGRELNAGTMLEGSVRKAGNHLRITVQLLDTVEDKHLWARSYDRELQDIFAVQSDIARNVAESVKIELLPAVTSQIQKRPTASTEAYLFYLKGKQEATKRSEEGARKAIDYFTQALDHDPNFALPYVGLADAYFVLRSSDRMTPAELTQKAKQMVSRALQLDETLAEAHAFLGSLQENDWDWDIAEAEYKRAIELNPSYSMAHLWYSGLLEDEGRLGEALSEAKKALELDPLAPMMGDHLGMLSIELERYDDAIEYCKKSLLLEPNSTVSMAMIAFACAYKGDFDEAVVWWEKFARDPRSEARHKVVLATLQAIVGKREEAMQNLDSALKLKDSKSIPPSWVSWVYSLAHDERAFDWLNRALEQHDAGVLAITTHPLFKWVRSRPRYSEMLGKLGLDKYSQVSRS